MCINSPGVSGPPGEEGPPGPPSLTTLITEWLKDEKVLEPHFYWMHYTEGSYIQTFCNHSKKQKKNYGYAIAYFPSEEYQEKRGPGVAIFYHGNEPRVRGYLRIGDPLFFDKLREFLILGHDGLSDFTNCKIKYTFEETQADRSNATYQPWWIAGGAL